MAEYKPLTKEERAEIDVRIAKMYRVYHQTETHETLAQAIRRYEATVQDRDDRIAALKADNARLREKAEVGEAVEGMKDYLRAKLQSPYLNGDEGEVEWVSLSVRVHNVPGEPDAMWSLAIGGHDDETALIDYDGDTALAALEAELDGCQSGSAYWEDSARYESKMRARAEAELTRLRPLADALTDGRWLEAPDSRHETYRLWDAGVGVGNAKLVAEGKTLAELAAALRTAKGEDDA